MTAVGAFVAAAVIVAVGVVGCGGGGASSDGGPSVLSESGVRLGCDPAGQDCPPGQTCDFFCDGAGGKIACRPIPAGGGVAAGEPCNAPEVCAAATGCYATATDRQSCVKYCQIDGDCSQGTCQERRVSRVCPVGGRVSHVARFCLP